MPEEATNTQKIQTLVAKIPSLSEAWSNAIEDQNDDTIWGGAWSATVEHFFFNTKVFDPETFSGGAWEVAFRTGSFDASDYRGLPAAIMTNPNASALKARDYTLGIMFVPSPNVRFMGNFVHTSFSDLLGTGPALNGRNIQNENALLFRTQLAF